MHVSDIDFVLTTECLCNDKMHILSRRPFSILYRKDCCPLVCKEWAQLLRAPVVWNQVVLEPSLASGSRLIAEMMADWLRVRSTVCHPSLLCVISVVCHLYKDSQVNFVHVAPDFHAGYQRPQSSSV